MQHKDLFPENSTIQENEDEEQIFPFFSDQANDTIGPLGI